MYCTNCGNKETLDSEFCTNCGKQLQAFHERKKLGKYLSLKSLKKGFFIFGAVFGILIMFLFVIDYFSKSKEISSSVSPSTNNQTYNYNQAEIVAPVVNIFCLSTESDEDVSGGSGTIITEDGLILTNSHIIPQDEINLFTGEEGCLVVLPNSETGQPEEYFWAEPIVVPELSDTYDLAFMQIYDAYYDEEEQSYSGTFPRKFPAFDDSNRCVDEFIQLGESVRIFGYPAISGGYSLTITDGIVSSFPGEGLIVTSAKISHGNSGGLAVDKNGCMIGIPSLVSGDEYESLGMIISNDLIYSFIDEATKLVNDKI